MNSQAPLERGAAYGNNSLFCPKQGEKLTTARLCGKLVPVFRYITALCVVLGRSTWV